MAPDFRYTNAAKTARPGYLLNKWNRLYPGWNKRPKPAPLRPVLSLPRRAA
jgi:hypothetical protein